MDVRYSVRVLLKSRGTSLIAVIALALGIGANTLIFSVVRSVLLRPLPYRDPGRLVSVLLQNDNPLGSEDFRDIREKARSFERAGAAELWSGSLTSRDVPQQIIGMHVTEDLFRLLGAVPVRGRIFDASDFTTDNDRVLVIGYELWQREFSGQDGIIGKKVVLDSEPYTVIGVMPRGFYFAPFWVTQAEMWAPDDLSKSTTRRGGGSLRMFARLAPGVNRSQAQAEMSQIAAALAGAFPESDTGLRLVVESLPDKATAGVRPALELMLGVVGMVLLIACANVANLSLARTTARRKEIAVRLALGAGRSSVARLFLLESLVLSLCGGAAGVLLARWGLVIFRAMLRPDEGMLQARLLQADQIALDGPVLMFTLGVAMLTGILFGLAPALAAGRGDINLALKETGRGSSAAGSRLRRTLVAAEIAVALVLLIGSGLLMRSFLRLRAADAGFDARNVVTMTVSVAGRTDYIRERRDALYRNVLDRVAAVRGIRTVSMTNHLPVAGDQWGFGYWIEGLQPPPPGQANVAVYRSCRPNYFAAMGAELIAGRDFSDADAGNAPPVAIVNETLAKRHFGGESPVGKRISLDNPGKNPKWITVVGVIRDMAQSWGERIEPEVYIPYWQDPRLTQTTKPFAAYMTLVARADTDAGTLIGAVKAAVWSVDHNLAISSAQTMEHAIGNATWQSQFTLLLVGLFSALALLLAIIGVYSVMAYEVTQRMHEIGIRLALGAGARGIIQLVARQSFPVAFAGIAVGLGAAAGLVRFMRSMLYQIEVLDPVTFTSVAGLMLAVAILAAIVPTRRAMRVDPMNTLRNE
jgi:putative ABC transport system permease protein